MGLNGWHCGERLIHEKLGHSDSYGIMSLFHSIAAELPEEHALFYTTRLHFLPIVTLDSLGRPWGSVLAGSDGKPGFVHRSRYSYDQLSIDTKLWPGEPFFNNMDREGASMLVAGIGVEYSTRRRNKFAGRILKLERQGENFRIELLVNEAIGNCPKYITIRDFVPYPNTSPSIVSQKFELEPNERLPPDVVSFILESDTVFLGTTYAAPDSEAARYPSHLGMNQRGGRKGFIRVMSDGRTVVLPDYSGNRFMTSLGNIEATPLASLTFISFLSGSILHLTGIAKNLIGPAAQDLMPLHSQHALTTIHITGYTQISDALPVRQRPESTALSSPYSPPVRVLAEEPGGATRIEGATATLTKIRMHSPTIATFTWSPSSSSSLSFSPGQAAILDFTPLLGQRAYQHMAQSQPTSVNDDRIRTWTVSSVNLDSDDSETSKSESFSLTMREKPGGAVTGALFSIARKLQEVKPELLEDTRPISLTVGLVGVTGDFVLPSPSPSSLTSSRTNKLKFAWFAGGIGVTPFLAMLRGLGEKEPEEGYEYDIQLVLSAREPEVFVPLIQDALQDLERARARAQADGRRKIANVVLAIDFFSNQDVPQLHEDGNSMSTGVTVVLRSHKGRVTREGLGLELEQGHVQCGMDLNDREIYVCGPGEFEQAILGMLGEVGVDRSSVRTEGFEY